MLSHPVPHRPRGALYTGWGVRNMDDMQYQAPRLAAQEASAERNAILRELRSINGRFNWIYFLLVLIVVGTPGGERIGKAIIAIFDFFWGLALAVIGFVIAVITQGH